MRPDENDTGHGSLVILLDVPWLKSILEGVRPVRPHESQDPRSWGSTILKF